MSKVARPITFELLEQFEQWTRMANMFTSSPEGVLFGEEMRAVINLARVGLSLNTKFTEAVTDNQKVN